MDLVETEGKFLVVIQFLWGLWLCLVYTGSTVTAGKAIQMQAISKYQYLCWDVAC